MTALALAAQDFWALLDEHPRSGSSCTGSSIRRLRLADLQRKEFSGSNTLSRVSRRLRRAADRTGSRSDDGVTITLPISQEELAGWTGASREAVTKALRTLRDLGWIETGRARSRSATARRCAGSRAE